MTVSTTVLFGKPQQEIGSLLRDRLGRCRSASLVAGFMTVEGLEAIAGPLRSQPGKLLNLVVGAGTYRAYEALDRLISYGVAQDRLRVHLGHSRPTTSAATHKFYRYHPMLHSKVYFMEMDDGTACAFVGSHNLTGFALLGLNGEAGVLIEGPGSSPEFIPVRQHIAESVAQAVEYEPGMKEAYSWWTTQFVEGFRDKIDDLPRDGEGKRTIVILAVNATGPLPKKGDVIYFEIPAALGAIQSLRAEVHIYIFAARPVSPSDGLSRLDECRKSLWCRTIGLEDDQGGSELLADWFIDNSRNPTLRKTPRPFRPTPSPDMQQVRVRVANEVLGDFEYLFDTDKTNWEPVFENEESLAASSHDRELLGSLNLVPPEDKGWFRVKALRSAEPDQSVAYRDALRKSAPESGSYVLFSRRRRRRSKG